jgi:hypothetical protein
MVVLANSAFHLVVSDAGILTKSAREPCTGSTPIFANRLRMSGRWSMRIDSALSRSRISGGMVALDKSIKYDPRKTILKIRIGNAFRVKGANLAHLAATFFAALESMHD